jgi:hypothetical protein
MNIADKVVLKADSPIAPGVQLAAGATGVVTNVITQAHYVLTVDLGLGYLPLPGPITKSYAHWAVLGSADEANILATTAVDGYPLAGPPVKEQEVTRYQVTFDMGLIVTVGADAVEAA